MEYNFREVEMNWQKYWAQHKTFKAEDNSSKPKYYVLDMFPYPSGAGLHVGHPLGYIASDIVARYKRLCGFNVLHPMGFDSFGLPAEQYAIQTGQHPKITTENNIARYRQQLDRMGFSFDWDREVRTSDPSYYKWTQWIFIQIYHSWYNKITNKAEPINSLIAEFEKNGNTEVKAVCDETISIPVHQDTDKTGLFSAAQWKSFTEKEKQAVLMNYRLAYMSEAWVNWCPQLGTVLANDEVKDGVSERGGYPVERKRMPQWSMRITAYAERLLNDLDGLDWTESMKESQRNWIGKSTGSSLMFTISDTDFPLEVFTTRPDTIFGVSFMTLAPEHELVEKITTADQKTAVEEYITYARNRSERERQADVKKITGQFTGAHAIHPFTGKQIPIWIGDYVLAGYGTGAVMGVPAHDSRDYAFAKHFDLPILEVVSGGDLTKESHDAKEGKLIHSDFLNGLEVKDALKQVIAEIGKRGLGHARTNYRLRDAAFGRQRYWGEPIPVYYKEGIPYTIEESELPLVLPEIDSFQPTENGEPPLSRAKDWKYKNEFTYETTTMPGWAGSSWYYLRYMDSLNPHEFASRIATDYWKDVDLYIGGAEHATGHLLYVRFWTKFLHDLNLISGNEPAKKLINQGMIQGSSCFAYRIDAINTFISAGLYAKYIALGSDEQGKDFLVKLLQESQFPQSSVETVKTSFPSVSISKLHVDVSFAENNVLNIEKFKSWRVDYKNAQFILEAGNYSCGSEVEKMSKSKHNVVSPDEICDQYGADCLRLYEMFLGPLEQSKPWNTNGITGVSGFIRKLWRLYHSQDKEMFSVSEEPATKAELKILHRSIKKVQDDIDRFSFNTSVSNFMICVNELTEQKCSKRAILEPLAILVSPYAPHISEELWKLLGHNTSISGAHFPEYKEEYTLETAFNYPVSLNGKTKFYVELDLRLSKEDIEKEILAQEQTQKLLDGKPPKKVIVVQNKIVNIVV
jgi:leucyl-tRNA synthetase